MAKLTYSAITSLDGYVETRRATSTGVGPTMSCLRSSTTSSGPIGTYLYGRRMYETMVFWETVATGADQAAVVRDFAAIWRGAEKVVYSRTLESASSAKTRIEREFDPEAVRQMKEAVGSDITIGGAELAGEAIRAGLVDEYHLFLVPVLVGAGKRSLPGGVRAQLHLLDERRFGSGVVHLRYRI